MLFSGIAVPKRISPCPIYEAVVEIRFDSSFPEEMIPGLLYPKFQNKYPTIENMPILQIPKAIRESDPNLGFNAHFRFVAKNIAIQVGPRVFSVLCKDSYMGWNMFFKHIEESFDELIKARLIDRTIRLGLRYINFFPDTDIFQKLNVNVQFGDYSLLGNKNNIRTEIADASFTSVIHISNNVTIPYAGRPVNGSIIDIDVVNSQGALMIKDYAALIEEAHNIEKRMFFGLLNEDYLRTLSPEY